MEESRKWNHQIEEGRLDTIIRGWGHLTKREIRQGVADGTILVNGTPASSPFMYCRKGTVIEYKGERLEPRPFVTAVYYKPSGWVCMQGENTYPSVYERFAQEEIGHSLFAIGRLDVDTEGLLLMSNDGKLCQRITRPESNIKKTYLVSFSRPLTEDAEERLREGIVLPNGVAYRPAEIEFLGECQAEITVTEGKYHEVKRLIRACGAYVTALKRIAIGTLRLPDELQPGEYRVLTEEEIEMIFVDP